MTDKIERSIEELYRDDAERADAVAFGRVTEPNRRGFLGGAGLAAMSAATSGAAPNFSFDFAAPKPKADKKADGEEGDEDDEDEEDEEDPVEEFIKSLPEPVQKCVSALDTLDEEICDLETQFRKDLRDLERKVCACSPCFGALRRVCGHERVVLEGGRAGRADG